MTNILLTLTFFILLPDDKNLLTCVCVAHVMGTQHAPTLSPPISVAVELNDDDYGMLCRAVSTLTYQFAPVQTCSPCDVYVEKRWKI
ncbi:hypothetical protein CSKR_203595 [Clonorchis sinensis]|uniref:Secreted protein n=1 Tax=Clonorchis sinensis TaxID=79923 RepID=A0A8T1MCP7_CLOSI|nr:hypothetical protein CSKR_203595 [Clonorchis sinensis]